VDQLAVTFAGPKIQVLLARLSLCGLDLVALSGFRLQQVLLGQMPARVLGWSCWSRRSRRRRISATPTTNRFSSLSMSP
jgi:hypothetical protein